MVKKEFNKKKKTFKSTHIWPLIGKFVLQGK